MSVAKRLLGDEASLLKWAAYQIDPKQWPEDIHYHLTFDGKEIKFALKTDDWQRRIYGFQEYEADTKCLELLASKRSLDAIPVSSSECERGFFGCNLQ